MGDPLHHATPAPEAAADRLDGEAGLIAGAVAGDRAAFARLYQAYVGRVYRYAISRLHDPADAEDLTSQTFLRALNALPRYRHRGHFRTWLFTIAHNLVIDHYRRRRAQGPLEALADHASAPDPAADLTVPLERRSLADRMRALSQDEQELLHLRYVADLPHDEIGRIVHRSTGAVKKSIYRSLARLQQWMEDEHA